MNTTPILQNISELICTRISHDLIGNIGAVSNAVELLEEGDLDFLEDIKSILKTSSQVLTGRLKFFRLAFGLNNFNLDDQSHITEVMNDYLKTIGNQNHKIELEVANYSAFYVKIVMICVMILADCAIKGGKICISEDRNKLFVNISSVTKLSEQKKNVITTLLTGAEAEYLAQYAPVFYLRELLKTSGLHIGVSDEDSFGFIIG